MQATHVVSSPAVALADPALWVSAEKLDAAFKASLLEKVKSIPRPPQAMQLLLSEEFIKKATSSELANLVKSDPAVVAKVIATVNSPLYSLRTAVETVGQAITFLGVNQVRGLCVQLMLADCFKSKDPRVGMALDAVWQSNRAAGVLLPKMALACRLDNAASLTSKVILSFVGQLAMAGLMPVANLATWSRLGRVLRYRMEQGFVGINTTELGTLVLSNWQVQGDLIRDVVAMDRVLVDPLASSTAREPAAAAVGYLCVWMAEQLARGLGSASASPWSPIDKEAPELQAWLSYGDLPGMQAGTAALNAAPMQALYTQIRQGQSE
jgi:HD-like signal output (HDOD) protein